MVVRINPDGFQTLVKVNPVKYGDSYFLSKNDVLAVGEARNIHKLLYFLRKNKCRTFYDSPVMGSIETVLLESAIEGPSAGVPIMRKPGEDYFEETIKRIIPADEMPRSFEEVSLVNYGSKDLRLKSVPFVGVDYDMVNYDMVNGIKENALKNLKALSPDLKTEPHPNMFSSGLVDGCVFKLRLDNYINLVAFGLGNAPQQLIKELGLSDLENAFALFALRETYPFFDLVFNRLVQRGLAYNLQIQQLDLENILDARNIIL